MNRMLILFCIFLVFVSACKDDASKIRELDRECIQGDQEACQELADIAKNNEDFYVRATAVSKLTDQDLLADIAKHDKEWVVSIAAVCKLALTDQAALSKVAADDIEGRVNLIIKFITAFDYVPVEHRDRLILAVLPAIRVLSSPAVVSKVGYIVSIETEWKSTSRLYGERERSKWISGENFTCSIQVQRLSEPLSHTWSTDFPHHTTPSGSDFIFADVHAVDLLRILFEKITEQSVLADIANDEKEWEVRQVAVEKLTDQKILASIARNDAVEYVRRAAVENLNDQKLLDDIASNDDGYIVREAAEKRLKELREK